MKASAITRNLKATRAKLRNYPYSREMVRYGFGYGVVAARRARRDDDYAATRAARA